MTPSLPLDRGWSHSPIVLRFLFSLLLLLLSGLPLIDAESVGAQDVSATLQDSLQTDNDMNNKADAGDTFRYTLVISNTDVMDASGVIAEVTLDANLMFLPGSIHSTPISRKDLYTTRSG